MVERYNLMNKGKIILGVLAGATIGATLVILFAPEKVAFTRRKISKRGEDYLNNLKTKYKGFFITESSELENLKDMTSDFLSRDRNSSKK